MHLTRLLGGAVLAAAALAAPAHAQAPAPVVTVTGGEVSGYEAQGAKIFRGIPFAAPPTGASRWRPPAPVVPWTGQRDATKRAPSCLQNDERWNHDNYLHASEDCLTLDVRTSSLTGSRPVIVWIHGGSNRSGAADGPVQSRLSDRGVVVVSIQYRLGILGFLAHRALAREQGGPSGNYGLMDQIAALRWVKDNIAKFGGDPGRVTIFGESAGSQDVSLLLAAPAAQGLFRAAILQSGTPGFGMSYRTLEEGFALGDKLDEAAKSGGDIERLRALSPVALFKIQETLGEPKSRGADFTWLRTTIDGSVLPEEPEKLLARAAPKPVIIGTDKIEFGPAPGSVDLSEFSTFWFGRNGDQALAAYQAEQLAGVDPRRGGLELRMQSDAQFHCPANRLANLLSDMDWPVWRYEFDVGENGGTTRHAYEIGFVFDRKPVGGGVQMQDYWIALATGLDPNAKLSDAWKRVKWEQTSRARPRTLELGEKSTAMVNQSPRTTFCAWSEAY